MSSKIKFGTDGWRASVAEDYTFDNVRRCAQGFASYLLKVGGTEKGIIVGHEALVPNDNSQALTKSPAIHLNPPSQSAGLDPSQRRPREGLIPRPADAGTRYGIRQGQGV